MQNISKRLLQKSIIRVLLNSSFLLDPAPKAGHPGINTRVVGPGTAITPGNCANKFAIQFDWSSGITLLIEIEHNYNKFNQA